MKFIMAYIKSIIKFEIFYKTIIAAAIIPVSYGLLQLSFMFSNIHYLTNNNLGYFINRPSTILILIFCILIVALLSVSEIISIYFCIDSSYKSKKVPTIEILIRGILSYNNFKILPIVVFIMILSNIGIIAGIFTSMKTPGIIARLIFKNQFNIYFPVLIILLLCMSAIPMVYKLFKGKLIRTSVMLLFFTLANYFLINILSSHLIIYFLIWIYIMMPISYTFITYSVYCSKYVILDAVSYSYKTKNIFTYILVFLIFALVINISFITYNSLKVKLDYNEQILNNIEITAHRGESKAYPENTKQAFESAVIHMTDYIELDVRLTKDNVPIVFHDTSLNRITGLDYKISDLYYDDIKNLDAGSWFDEKFSQARIPTLEETIKLLKGKVRLNIELKPADNNDSLVEKVLELVNKYDIVNECLVTSSNYDLLKIVKEYSAKYRTGYILLLGYGQLEKLDYADVICLNAAFVTKTVVDNLHRNEKEIQVWTVNDDKDIQKMIALGVDNIITDDTLLVNRTINTQTTSSFSKLLSYLKVD